MRYLHKVMPLPSEADLDRLGKDGWCVSAVAGDKVILVKTRDEPTGVARVCANCGSFCAQKDAAETGRCPEWNLLMAAKGTCGKWAVRGEADTEKSVPDEVSAWHWTPRTEIGEKRIEAITTQVAGIVAPEHKHRVMVIRARDGSVVRGKTDVVNGHDHLIKVMGMAEESDGHTHTFLLPQES